MKRILSFVTAAAFSSTMLSGAFSGAGITFVHAADSKDVVDVFMDNYDAWNEYDWYSDGYSAVGFLDIDFDGELELVNGNFVGSGHFTYLHFYKIEGNQVKAMPLCAVADEGFPDFLYEDSIYLYKDSKGNLAYYADDYVRVSSNIYGKTFCSFAYDSVQNEVIINDYWATGTENGNDWWYDCQNSKELTESEYESLTEKEMAQLTDLELHCKFTDIRKMSMDEIKIALIESYKSFSYNGFTSSEPVEDELIELAVPQPTSFYNYAVSQKIGSKDSPRYAGDGDSWYLMWNPVENADCYEIMSERVYSDSFISPEQEQQSSIGVTTETFYYDAASIPIINTIKIRAKRFLSNGEAIYSEWSEPRTAYISCADLDTDTISDYDKEGWRDAYRDLLKIYATQGTDIFPDNEFTMMYGLKDLNQDGIPELLISFSDVESDDGYVVHTYDGKAEVVLDQYGVRTYVDRLKEFETLVSGLSTDARAYLLSDTSGIDTWGSSTPEEPSAITVNAKAYEGRYCGEMEYLSTSSNAMVSGLWRVELEAVSETELSAAIELLNPDTKEIHSRVVYQGDALETIIFEAEDKYGGWNTNAYTLKLSDDSLHLNAKCQIFYDELHGWQIPDADITLHRETETPVNRSISGWTDSQIADAINTYLTGVGDKSADFFGGYLYVTALEFQEDEAGRYVTAHLKDAGTGATQIEYRIRWNNEDDIATFGANGTDSYYLFHLTDFVKEYGDYVYYVNNDNTIVITQYNGSDADVIIPSEIEGKPVTVISGVDGSADVEYQRVGAFELNTNLKSVVIPDTVTVIEQDAFKACYNLTNVTMSENVRTIEQYAFEDCNLSYIYLPETIERIEDYGIGYYGGSVIDDFVIYGFSETIAETYANDHDILFIARNSDDTIIQPLEISLDYEKISDLSTLPDDTVSLMGYPVYKISAIVKNIDLKTANNVTVNLNPSTEMTLLEGEVSQSIDIINSNDTATFTWTVKMDATQTYSTRCKVTAKADNSVESKSYLTVTFDTSTIKQDNRFDFTKDTWWFTNSADNYPKGYYIQDKYLQQFLAKIPNTSVQAVKNALKKKWGGSCYGMSITSILAKIGTIKISDFDSDASFVHNAKNPKSSDEISSLINAYQVSWNLPPVQNAVNDFGKLNTHDKLVRLVDSVENVQNGGSPVAFYLYWYTNGASIKDDESDYSVSAHEMVAYDIQYLSKPEMIKNRITEQKEPYTIKISIYDCSTSGNEPIFMYVNSDLTHWIIPVLCGSNTLNYWNNAFGVWMDEENDGDFYDKLFEAIEGRSKEGKIVENYAQDIREYDSKPIDGGGRYSTLYYAGESDFVVIDDPSILDCFNWGDFTKNQRAILTSNKKTQIQIKWNNSQYKFWLDQLLEGNPGDISVFYGNAAENADGISEANFNYVLPSLTDEYTVTTSNSPESNIDYTLTYENSMISVEASSAKSVTFTPDSVNVQADGGDFEVALTFNEGYYEMPWYTVTATGDQANEVTMEKTADGIVLTSDNMENISVSANNTDETVEVTFNSESDHVLITNKMDELEVCADLDNNGEYETVIATSNSMLSDGEITALVQEADESNPYYSIEPLQFDFYGYIQDAGLQSGNVKKADIDTYIVSGYDYSTETQHAAVLHKDGTVLIPWTESGNLFFEDDVYSNVEYEEFFCNDWWWNAQDYVPVNANFYDKNGTLLFEHELYEGAGVMKNGITWIAIKTDNDELMYKIIDKTGNVIKTLVPPDTITSIGEFSEGLVAFKTQSNQNGYFDTMGNIVIQANATYIEEFHDGIAVILEKDADYETVIDKTGKAISNIDIYERAGHYVNGRVFAHTETGWKLIDLNGNVVLDDEYDDVGIFCPEGYAAVLKTDGDEELYGYIDTEGNEVIPLSTTNIVMWSFIGAYIGDYSVNGLFRVGGNNNGKASDEECGQFGLHDANDRVILPAIYDQIEIEQSNGLVVAWYDEKPHYYQITSTDAETSETGDVDHNGSINASDATQILIAAALIGAGESSGLTAKQEESADVNSDGEINATDAAIILMYSAAIGAGESDTKISDYF